MNKEVDNKKQDFWKNSAMIYGTVAAMWAGLYIQNIYSIKKGNDEEKIPEVDLLDSNDSDETFTKSDDDIIHEYLSTVQAKFRLYVQQRKEINFGDIENLLTPDVNDIRNFLVNKDQQGSIEPILEGIIERRYNEQKHIIKQLERIDL